MKKAVAVAVAAKKVGWAEWAMFVAAYGTMWAAVFGMVK